MYHDLPVAIAIPVFNRADQIGAALHAALIQSHPDCITIAIDDGSEDATWQEMQRFADHPRLTLIRLRRNLGSGPAKNVAIMLAGGRAISFHDSDDRPHPDKLLRQSRVLGRTDLTGDPGLNWRAVGLSPGAGLRLAAVFCHHELILPNGERRVVRREISVVDDLFPNAQPEQAPGDWLHINSGLFHPEVFRELGGYADSVEEDRDLRNRLLFSGQVMRVIEEPLLTKIETADSLTLSPLTGYDSPRRRADREAIWREVDLWFRKREVSRRAIDLPLDAVAEITHPELLSPSQALMSGDTRAMAERLTSHITLTLPQRARPSSDPSELDAPPRRAPARRGF